VISSGLVSGFLGTGVTITVGGDVGSASTVAGEDDNSTRATREFQTGFIVVDSISIFLVAYSYFAKCWKQCANPNR
jgi:hypothetical protein